MAKTTEDGRIIRHGLSEQQYAFAAAYVETLKVGKPNTTSAAREAGYGKTSYKAQRNAGSRLMHHPGVWVAIDELHAEFLDDGPIEDLSPEEVIGMLRNEAKTAKSDQARVSAAVALGKVLAIFTDKVETVAPDLTAVMNSMSDQDVIELAKLLQGELQERGILSRTSPLEVVPEETVNG